MSKVISEKTGIIHAYACCSECDYTDAINTQEKNRMQKLRNRVYTHVKTTSHRVVLETGNSFEYSLKK